MFTEAELQYLYRPSRLEVPIPPEYQRLGRLATVDASGQPRVDPVVFYYGDGEFLIGNWRGDITDTQKGKNVGDGRIKVSLVIDDFASTEPWEPRGVLVHGEAEVVELDGHLGPGTYLVVRPATTWSWGIERSTRDHTGKARRHRTQWR